MKICVLQPDYTGSTAEYKDHDPPRDLGPLLPESRIEHLFLNKASTYRQLREVSRAGFDIYVNLCEGYLDWDTPGIDVIAALDTLGLAYTGPSARIYDPSKPLMKYVAHTVGVAFPAFVEVTRIEDVARAADSLGFPLFVKPAQAGDSLGIDQHSRVGTAAELRHKCDALLPTYGRLVVEQYVPGREVTVLVAGAVGGGAPVVLQPIEFIFPVGTPFKTYALKVTEHHPERNVPLTDPEHDHRVRAAAAQVFSGFAGVGYARLDFRIDPSGQIYFLDINFACSIFYPKGHEGSADYILQHDPIGSSGFLRHIIAEGQARHARRRRRFERRGNASSGFGIFAVESIHPGEVVFAGEERSQRIVTRSHVERNWDPSRREAFRRYAYPLSDEVFVLWDEDPENWAPQNHSCSPNTGFCGLDVVALREIARGEELTLDYQTFASESMEPFNCRCGSADCRRRIEGAIGNSVTSRARRRVR